MNPEGMDWRQVPMVSALLLGWVMGSGSSNGNGNGKEVVM